MIGSRPSMDWRLKGAIQKLLGYVPAGDRIHYWLQRNGGGLTDFARECDIKMDDWRLMIGHLRAAKIPVAGTRFLEMGTGWYPTFPFALYLGGAASVETLDLNRHLKPDRVRALVARLAEHVPQIARETEPARGRRRRRPARAGRRDRGRGLGRGRHRRRGPLPRARRRQRDTGCRRRRSTSSSRTASSSTSRPT